MSPAASSTASAIGLGVAVVVGASAGAGADPVEGSVGDALTGAGAGELVAVPVGVWAHELRARTIATAGPRPATLLDRATASP
jgi:hypothetical protein